MGRLKKVTVDVTSVCFLSTIPVMVAFMITILVAAGTPENEFGSKQALLYHSRILAVWQA